MLGMIPSVFRGICRGDLERIKAITRAAFPSVRQLSTRTLAVWLGPERPKPVLIDVRSPREFAVSHLAGAVNLRDREEIRALAARAPDRPLVLYCAVGFRSSMLAEKLRRAGLPGEIYNLEGSIFQWANEGRPVFRGGESVSEVHPFARRWAGLLAPERVAKEV